MGFRKVLVAGLALLPGVGPLRADVTRYLQLGSEWRYLPGLAEPSADAVAWRGPSFDDGSWAKGRAPFGYAVNPPLGTDLSRLAPPMRANYSTLYLRSEFELTDPSRVVVLQANFDYDDGFIVWINGVEVARSNAPESPAPPFDAIATQSHSPGELTLFDELPNPQAFLVKGANVVAVQAFNLSKTNNDFKFDVELFDPFGPDLSPPRIAALTPPAGAKLRSLTQIEILFSEDVRGLEAADLLIGGSPASSVSGSGTGPFVFGFDSARDGAVDVQWRAGHGITDAADAANPFSGGSWMYTVDSTAPEVDLVISEISATGSKEIVDGDRDESDWIEIWNRGLTRVSLGGWSLSDDADDPGKWVFPDLSLAAGDRLLVFASGKDRSEPAGELHTNFSLSAAGEYLGLFRPESPRRPHFELKPRFPEQRFGYSYGLDPGGRPGYFRPPSPGAANGAAVSLGGFVSEPLLGVPHGLYDAPFRLSMTSTTAGAAIRYTLDGSEPTIETGAEYTTPIEIAGTAQRAVVTVRAAGFKEGRLPSRVVTSTYVFPALVLSQPARPDGFPISWGTQPADYAMDPSVVAQTGERALTGLSSIPTLSVVAHVDDLFGRARGVYANPSLSGPAWERPVSAELIYPDGRRGFQVDCGIRVTGGSSTSDWKSVKVSLRLIFRGDYGAKKLDYKLFEGSLVDRYDTVVLDAHLNLAYTHPDHAQRVRSQFVRDIFVSDLQRATGSLAPYGNFVHLYLDGLYWGMYDLHERPDASFAAEHLGGDKGEYDVFRHNSSTIVDGNAIAWNEMFRRARANLALPENYQALGEYLDIDDLADYMLVNFYAGNTDWAHQNWYGGRRRAPGAGYRFFSWDAEHVLKSTNENVVGVNNPGGPGELYFRLRVNPEFRLLFADHVQRHFFGNGPFFVDPLSPAWDPAKPETNHPAARYMKRIAEIDTAVILESARWGDARRPGQPYTRDNEFEAELNLLLTTYFPQRSQVVLSQLAAVGLYPKLAAPIFGEHGGEVQPGFQLTLTLPDGVAGKIYVTTDGVDPRVPITGEPSSSAAEYSGPITIQDTTRVKARTFDAGTWSALGEASFTVVRPRDALRITEIHYHPPDAVGDEPQEPEFIEIQNVGGSSVDLSGLRFSSGIQFVFPRGTSLAAGALLVLTSDLDAFRARHPGVEPAGAFLGSLDNGGEPLVVTDASDEIVLALEYDDEGFWPQGPDGFGWSLSLRGTDLDPNDPASWQASAEPGGSPGAPESGSRPGGVFVHEILASSKAPYEDAIELSNETDRDVDIGGWFLSDDRGSADELRKFRIPDGTVIRAGGYAVFYEHDFNPGVDDLAGFGLSSRGDEVFLASADRSGRLTGHIVGHHFDATEPGVSIGVVETGAGRVFAPLLAPTFGVDSPRSVEMFREGRGAQNADALVGPVVLNEIHYDPASGVEFVEIHNALGSAVTLHDGRLGRGWRVSGLLDDDGTDDFEFAPGAAVPPNGFLVLVPIDPAAFREMRGVPANAVVIGPYRGALDNGGERLKLEKPVLDDGEIVYVTVDAVRFDDEPPWPVEADGLGPSLERRVALRHGDDPSNWGASTPEGGTPGAANSNAEPNPAANPKAGFDVIAVAGDALSVKLDASASYDVGGTIEKREWSFGDGGVGEGIAVTHAYGRAGRYTVLLEVTDDSGASAIAVRTISVPAPGAGAGGGQVPGDANGDARLDISDAIVLLRRLFFGETREPPCGGASIAEGGNLTLLDSDANGSLDLADTVYVLNYLYRGGPPPLPGLRCVQIPGCPEGCRAE